MREEFQKFASDYDENLKKISQLIDNLMSEIKSSNEEKIFAIINQLNSYPIRYSEFTELKELILTNISIMSITKDANLIEFLVFFDKFDLENYAEHFAKIVSKYEARFNYMSPEDLVTVIYNFSKFRIYEKTMWDNLLKIIAKQIDQLQTHSLTKLFLGLAMLKVSDPDLFPENSAEERIFSSIINSLSKEAHLDKINSQDVFRICISLTKKPINNMDIPDKLWNKMQSVFTANLFEYDLYQISQILLLFCETNFISDSLFSAIETEMMNSYFEKIKELQKLPEKQINLGSLLEDICKISFSFALTIKGSLNYWNNFFKSCLILRNYFNTPVIESLNFIVYRGVDYFSRNFQYDNLNKNLLDECYKNLDQISIAMEEKIFADNLLNRSELDPFNMMMPYARMINNNYKIWNYISQNILNVLQNPQFQMNPFLLSDLTYAFASHYSALLAENENYKLESNSLKNCENFENSFYIKNLAKIWEILEDQILKSSKYLEVTYVTNMVVDLSQINLELLKSWTLLADLVRDYMSKGAFDVDNFTLVLIGLKKRNYQDKYLWEEIEKYLAANIKKINLENLKKITLAMVKSHDTESQNIYGLIANRFCDQDIIEKYNFEQFMDLQIPFALIGIANEKIWNKFEEILFKNFETVKNNKPLLLSSIYSFSRLNKGSSLVWNKFAQIISEKLDNFDIDDLGHIGICLRENIISKFNLTKVLNEQFWNNFLGKVDSNIDKASLVTCNNFLIIFKENEIVKTNSKIIKKIQDRITLLSK